MAHAEPIRFVDSFPAKEELPIVKAIRIKPPRKEADTQTHDYQPSTLT